MQGAPSSFEKAQIFIISSNLRFDGEKRSDVDIERNESLARLYSCI
jgi:hypothetical protein